MNEWSSLCAKWLNPRWQSSRWLPSSSWVRINELSFLCANGGNRSWQVWVCLRGKTRMTESKMAEFKMTAIIKWSENEWVWVRLNYFESESEWSESVFEWIWEKITRCLNPRWQCLNPTWQNSRWLPSSSWVRMNEWIFLVQNGWIKDGTVQDSCNHQVESESMSEVFFVQMEGINLGKCEWVWEEKLRWLNPRWPNWKWQNSRWLPSSL